MFHDDRVYDHRVMQTARIQFIEFDEEHASRIITGMCAGRLLTDLCKPGEPGPLAHEVRRWAIEYPEFGTAFSTAMEQQAHMLFESAVIVARDAKPNEVGVARLKTDMLMKAAGKLLPKVYGDKSDVSTIIPVFITCNLGSDAGLPLEQRKFKITTGANNENNNG